MVTMDPSENLSPIKRALLEVRELRQRIEAAESAAHEPVAIIGAGLRFPGGVHDLDSFWRLLASGTDAIVEVPPDRWDNRRFYSPDADEAGKIVTRYGGFLQNVDHFDPAFFGIAPREAETMDPQQRLLLEVTWEALENATLPPGNLFNRPVGVYLGICGSDYYRRLLNAPEQIDTYTTTGNALSVAAGRIAYLLGLQGPNLAIDTACSSSLVAVHLACRGLRQKECELALAGGVNLILAPEISINFSRAHMLAPDGRCKTFDTAADGYVRSEGCAMIVLKRLSDARADGDTVLAVIRGSAINHDGRSGGLTAPNGRAQEDVIRLALADAGMTPAELGYIEAHGTGTSLGDPIEVHALLNALCRQRPAGQVLQVGSVKTNLGHLEAAAGIAGLLKTLLILRQRQIPPHLHFHTLNPHIDLHGAALSIPTGLVPWPNGQPLAAGVSSFGLSGTNAHIILTGAPEMGALSPAVSVSGALPAVKTMERPLHLLTLSAHRPAALTELASSYRERLSRLSTPVELGDLCFTAAARRDHFAHRLAVLAASPAEAAALLDPPTSGPVSPGVFYGHKASVQGPVVAFLFSGHGGNYTGMGQRLYETQPVFRTTLEACNTKLLTRLKRPLLSALYPNLYPCAEPAPSVVDSMLYALSALFSVQAGLLALWRSWGIQPALVLGHSAGEYAAAYAAGVLSLEGALELVAARTSLMDSLPTPGRMAAVFADPSDIEAALAPHRQWVALAAYNGPKNLVVSGERSHVDTLLAELRQKNIKTRPLAVSQAAHSPLMESILDDFARQAGGITFSPPQIGLVSCVSGELAQAGELENAAYWCRHLRQPVQFYRGMQALQALGAQTFVEIGPNPMLLALGERCLTNHPGPWLPSLRQNLDDWQPLLASLATLYTLGAEVDWQAFDAPYPRRRLSLPPYPFQRTRYWASAAVAAAGQTNRPSTWDALLQCAQQQAGQGPLNLNIASFSEKWRVLERLTTAYILDTLKGWEVFTRPGQEYNLDEFLAGTHVLPTYRGLMQRWLERLASAGWLEKTGERYTAVNPLPESGLEAARHQAARLEDVVALLEYIERCGNRLSEVLTGAHSALDTLFPGGSFELAEALYQHWSLSRYFAGLMRSVAQTYTAASGDGMPLRILEIGAGTGATTAAILPVLPTERVTYFYTDVSDIFLSRSESKFAGYACLRYGLLDIEREPAEQGFAPRSFDLIIAANVLHATLDLRQTLQHVQALLAPGGLLLLQESTTYLSWFDITTGLISGWQRFADGLRAGHPLLPVDRWQAELTQAGFQQVAAWPEPGSAAAILGQHVLIAQLPAGPGSRTEARPVLETAPPGIRVSKEAARPANEPSLLLSGERLRQALPAERSEILLDFVGQKVRAVLRLPASEALNSEQGLMDLGLDSLMALELRRQISRGLDLPEEQLSATLAYDYPTPAAIASYLLQQVLNLEQQPAQEPAPSAAEAQPVSSVDVHTLSDEEVEALLLQKLRKR